MVSPRLPTGVTQESLVKRLAKSYEQRRQMTGLFKATQRGVKRFLGSVEMDIAAKAPNFLYVSLRSFFNQPARVFSSDGTTNYLLEMSDPVNPVYRTCPVSSTELEKFIFLPLSPKEAVEVLLGGVRVKESQIKDLVVDENRDRYTLSFQNEAGLRVEILAKLSDDVILERSFSDKQGQLVYHVKYDNFDVVDGVQIAKNLYFDVHVRGKVHQVRLEAKELNLNGEDLDDTAFRIAPL